MRCRLLIITLSSINTPPTALTVRLIAARLRSNIIINYQRHTSSRERTHEVHNKGAVLSCDALMCPCSMHDGQRDCTVMQAQQRQGDLHNSRGMYPCMYLHVRAHDLICSGYIVHNVPSFEARHAPDKIVYATLDYEYLRYVRWILVVSHLRTFELRTAPPLTLKCPTFHSSRYPMNCSVPLLKPNSARKVLQ